MRGFQAKSRRSGWQVLAPLLVLGMLGAPGQSQLGQSPISSQSPELPSPPGQTNNRVPFGQASEANRDPTLQRAMWEATKKRNIDRQNRIVAETDKLLHLAEQLNGELSDKGVSIAEMKKAEEIEKLARSVKDRMRSE